MKDRTFLLHSALAAVAVIAAAAAAWMPSGAANEEEVVVIPGDPTKLSRIEWSEERYDVVVERAADNPEHITVAVTRKKKVAPKKKPAPAAADAAPDAAADESPDEADAFTEEGSEGDDEVAAGAAAATDTGSTTVSVKTYPGSKEAQELFDNLAPLKASRSLGLLEGERLAALGLDAPDTRLVLQINGQRRELQVGSATYGSTDRYVRGDGGEVFLLANKVLSSLRNGASGIVEKRAIPVEEDAIKKVTITAGARSRELIQRYGEDRKKAFFADPKVPDEKLEQVSNWIDRVLKLRIADVVAEEPQGPSSVEIKLVNGKSTLGTLRLWQPNDTTAIATSTLFATPVSITKANAEAILRDVEAVLDEGT